MEHHLPHPGLQKGKAQPLQLITQSRGNGGVLLVGEARKIGMTRHVQRDGNAALQTKSGSFGKKFPVQSGHTPQSTVTSEKGTT